MKKLCSQIFAKFTGKHLYRSLFFDKVACIRPATLLTKRLRGDSLADFLLTRILTLTVKTKIKEI